MDPWAAAVVQAVCVFLLAKRVFLAKKTSLKYSWFSCRVAHYKTVIFRIDPSPAVFRIDRREAALLPSWTVLSDGRDAARLAVEDRRWPDIVAEARWPLVGDGRCPRVAAAAIRKLWSDGLGTRSSDRSRPAAT